ncbi:hypothetical protein [Faucicola atlantae]|uniref:Methyltransferase domain-containing protein n=1 Tax=Faucicola atlantae TaxID=34059 RepID=A0A1B8QF22_9GAMM|nr:hypothetical protein [Moraxella atlantae]OBX80524.1 hypothetical protein A9306_07445 [Moraxella atlantae]
MNTIIDTACQSMTTQGFEGFYHSLVAQVAPNLPMTYRELVNRTDRATQPLASQNDALFYSVAYAMSHYTTFRAVLSDNLTIEDHDSVINIIDYGCGQGIATLAHIASQKDPKTVHLNIHLIEPSSVSLGNASYQVLCLAQAYGFSTAITSQNCVLANAIVPNFANGADTLHLMSYILDVPAVQQQLQAITKQIHQLSGVQHIIASDICRSEGFYRLNLLSRQLTGGVQRIERYTPAHRSYRVIQQRYETGTAKAIGFMLSLNNDSAFYQSA